jgi:hypothetical protein
MGWLEECLLRKQRATFREHEHGWRALVSTPRCAFRPSTQSSLTAETAITATCQMSVYNFCRRRSACPAGTQCQSEIGCWWEKKDSCLVMSVACQCAQQRDRKPPSNITTLNKKPTECARHVAARLLFLSFLF